MNENIDFIVLEHDDGAGCALIAATVDGAVPAIDGYNTPYIVAEGYDHAARDWEDCRLFDDIGKAKLAYEKLRGRDYSLDADMPDSIAFRAKHSDIGTALLAMTEADGGRITEGGTLPYAVARGYDADARTWESIEPFDDVTHAKLRFEKECGRDYVPTGGKLYDDEFITLRWRRKDIADSLENDWGNFGFPIPATEKNVERAMDQLGNHIDDAVYSQGWDVIHDHLDPNSFDLGVGHSVQAREFYEQVLEHAGDYDCTVNIWPAVDGGGVHVSVCPVAHGGNDLAVYSVDADKIGDSAITVRDLEDVGCREVYVEDFTERPDEVRFFLRTDADAYMFGSSLGKSLTVQYTGKEDIAPALREVRAYCKDAAEKRDPCLIGAMAQASAAKSATAEGEAGGKKL